MPRPQRNPRKQPADELTLLERELGITERLPTLEELFTLPAPVGVGVTTATPVQRALAHLLEGKPIPDRLWDDPWENYAVRQTFGNERPIVTDEIQIISGVRGAKTYLCVLAAILMTQRVSFPTPILPGERPRINFVSQVTDLVEQALGYVRGLIRSVPSIQALLFEQPTDGSDTFVFRHPSGVPIEITIVAAAKAGATLVSRWCAGVLFDEFPRMASSEDSVKGVDEMMRAVRGRMLPGALIMYVGSPVGRIGTAFKMFTENFGKAGAKIAVARAKGPWLNPIWWTPANCNALKSKDYDAWLNDVEAEFRDIETAFLSSLQVDSCVRPTPITYGYDPSKVYTAVMDPGTRGNSWTFGIAHTDDNRRFHVDLAMQWTGSQAQPLSPRAVLKDLKPILDEYHIETVKSDQHMADALRDLAQLEGIGFTSIAITSKIKNTAFQSLKVRINASLLDLPPVDYLRDDLVNLRLRIDSDSNPKVIVVETNDGRHCDYASMLALLCGSYIEETHAAEQGIQPRRPGLEEEDEPPPRDWWDDDDELQASGW